MEFILKNIFHDDIKRERRSRLKGWDSKKPLLFIRSIRSVFYYSVERRFSSNILCHISVFGIKESIRSFFRSAPPIRNPRGRWKKTAELTSGNEKFFARNPQENAVIEITAQVERVTGRLFPGFHWAHIHYSRLIFK